MRSRFKALALLVILPGAARAHSVIDEIGVGSQGAAPSSPSAGYQYERFGGEFTLNEHWDIRGDIMVTHDESSPPQQGAAFGNSGGIIPFFDVGADWEPNDHFSFGAEVDLSPTSSQFSDAPFSLSGADGGMISADSNLHTATSSEGFILNAGFDTAGDSRLETAGNASFGLTHFATVQSIAQLVGPGPGGTPVSYDLAAARTACSRPQARTRSGCAPLLGQPGDITQSRIGAYVTETIFTETDVGLAGAYYVYDKDPTTVGYFTLATRGRLSAGGSTSFGQGLAIAPYQFTLRPDVAHRFGNFRLDLSYQYGQYVPGQGYSNALALKGEYRFNRAWKVWVTVLGEKDVDGTGTETNAGSIVAGVRYRF